MPKRLPAFARSGLVISAVLALVAPPAGAATVVVARGAGFGHGVGMSQYGAFGQAKAGRTANQILATYFQGTTIAKSGVQRTVRVLLKDASSVRFSGAASIVNSARRLLPTATYVLRQSGGNTVLRSARGKTIATAAGAIRVSAAPGGAITVAGRALNGVTGGAYRGAVELHGTLVINQLPLEDYLRGVVASESPSSWPAAALQAQAIAARSYAVTTAKSDVFDQYPDTRSQVYTGVSGEAASTDAAIAATSGQFVTYQNKPITAYFFSSSGGRTENVENSFIGATPQPYLRSVADPWDKVSPNHTWQVRYTKRSLSKKLGDWVQGSLQSIDIIKRGVSPRVVRADIVGSGGRTSVTGPQLRTRLDLLDTWVKFVFVGASTAPLPAPSPTTPGPTNPTGGSGGVGLALMAPSIGAGVLSQVVARPPGYGAAHGRVWPGGGGHVVRLQVRSRGRWRTQLRVSTDATGRWTALLPSGIGYRVVALGVAGPVITAHDQ